MTSIAAQFVGIRHRLASLGPGMRVLATWDLLAVIWWVAILYQPRHSRSLGASWPDTSGCGTWSSVDKMLNRNLRPPSGGGVSATGTRQSPGGAVFAYRPSESAAVRGRGSVPHTYDGCGWGPDCANDRSHLHHWGGPGTTCIALAFPLPPLGSFSSLLSPPSHHMAAVNAA